MTRLETAGDFRLYSRRGIFRCQQVLQPDYIEALGECLCEVIIGVFGIGAPEGTSAADDVGKMAILQ